MSQRGKSAITFPYIILKPSHGNTGPSQPILTHEIWQAVPEVMHLLLGNRITITGCVHLGFRGRPGSQAADSLVRAGFTFRSRFHVWSSSRSVFVEWAQLCEHFTAWHLGIPIVPCGSHGQSGFWGSWTVSFLDMLRACVFFPPAKWCDPRSFPWAASKISDFFFLPCSWDSRCEGRCCWSWLIGHELFRPGNRS